MKGLDDINVKSLSIKTVVINQIHRMPQALKCTS
jgi:hypothetical protein